MTLTFPSINELAYTGKIIKNENVNVNKVDLS